MSNQTSITNGIVALGLLHYAIIIDGVMVDECHGDSVQAQQQRLDWLEKMATDREIKDNLETPFNELPDSYFKNGHIPRLTWEELEQDKAWVEAQVKAKVEGV